MGKKSHVDEIKIKKIPSGHPFEYKDVVNEDFPSEEHTDDGEIFKSEVLNGAFPNVLLDKDTGSHLLYRKK